MDEVLLALCFTDMSFASLGQHLRLREIKQLFRDHIPYMRAWGFKSRSVNSQVPTLELSPSPEG